MMPAIPASIYISEQMERFVRGKIIADISYSRFKAGKYGLSERLFDNLDKLTGSKIAEANSNFIITESGWLCEFGYVSGGLRYIEPDTDFSADSYRDNITGGFNVRFTFSDKSYLYFIHTGWCSRFDIRPVDPPVFNYPYRSKFPLDVTDKENFTLNNIKAWLSDKGKWNIIEALSLAKGATDIPAGIMSYILWRCSVHPKTKVSTLGNDELEKIREVTNEVINAYESRKHICSYTDILGNTYEGSDSDIVYNSAKLAAPCGRCGTPITAVSVGGTKAYLCPECQKIRK